MWSLGLVLVLAFVLMISVSWTDSRGAPWAPTPMGKVRKMLTMADVKPDDLVYDLGCGDGRLIAGPKQMVGFYRISRGRIVLDASLKRRLRFRDW